MGSVKKIAILGGGEEELNIMSEFHRSSGYDIVAIYDRDPRAIALEIAEIIGVPKYTDFSFLDAFKEADYVIVTDLRKKFEEEIRKLKKAGMKIINPSEAVHHLACETREKERPPWPAHLETALKYIQRITDRERLLKWLLEISVRSVRASTGSIMLLSEQTEELYIGYAIGLSDEVVKGTRQKIGEGIAGTVAESRMTELIEDVIDSPLYSYGRERQDIQSAISAPLVAGERLIGVLNVSTSSGEKKLLDEDAGTIELLAEKISPILDQHLRIDTSSIREKEYEIRVFLEQLFQKEMGFHEKFSFLCMTLTGKLGADTVTIYTATDEGDWLILGGSTQHARLSENAPRLLCNKGSLARAFIDGEEVIMTEAVHDATLRIKGKSDSITSIYLPLVHDAPLGVLVLEFSVLDQLEKFFKLKDTLRFQVGFFVNSELKELKQQRKMKTYEELSAITPFLIGIDDMNGKLKHVPGLASSLVRASMGSFFYRGGGREEISYYRFPEDEEEKKARIEFDRELTERTLMNGKPECISFMGREIEAYREPPPYTSVITYPIIEEGEFTAVFNGYNRKTDTPLDSSLFGGHDLLVMDKVRDILIPILKKKDTVSRRDGPTTFNELLKSNQKIFLERVAEEIERADRYHHGFTVTIFGIKGLTDYYKVSSHHALDLINALSLGLRKRVRRTDYFSWIETELFGVLSLESFQRVKDLEDRLCQFINRTLEERGIYDRDNFSAHSAFALYPGSSDTATELIAEAKSKL